MSHVANLQPSVLAQFAPVLTLQSYTKGEAVHTAGRVCHNLHLVQSGALRAFYFKEDKDITAHFAFSNEAITAPDSFIMGAPSKYHIEALEESSVYTVDRLELEKFLDEHPELERLARKFTEAIYLELLERIESLVFLSAAERYNTLLKRNPNLLLNVNLGHIASYLGITQETLSRIRAKAHQ